MSNKAPFTVTLAPSAQAVADAINAERAEGKSTAQFVAEFARNTDRQFAFCMMLVLESGLANKSPDRDVDGAWGNTISADSKNATRAQAREILKHCRELADSGLAVDQVASLRDLRKARQQMKGLKDIVSTGEAPAAEARAEAERAKVEAEYLAKVEAERIEAERAETQRRVERAEANIAENQRRAERAEANAARVRDEAEKAEQSARNTIAELKAANAALSAQVAELTAQVAELTAQAGKKRVNK